MKGHVEARRNPAEKPPGLLSGGVFVSGQMTGGMQVIVEAAKRELGNAITRDPVRLSCPGCGRFLASVFVKPNLIRDRCDKCRVDIVVLVTAAGEVVAATER